MMFAYKSAVGEGLAMQISDNLALDGDAVLNWSLIIVSRQVCFFPNIVYIDVITGEHQRQPTIRDDQS